MENAAAQQVDGQRFRINFIGSWINGKGEWRQIGESPIIVEGHGGEIRIVAQRMGMQDNSVDVLVTVSEVDSPIRIALHEKVSYEESLRVLETAINQEMSS